MTVMRVVTALTMAAALGAVAPTGAAAAAAGADTLACEAARPAGLLSGFGTTASTARGGGGPQREKDTRSIAGDPTIPAGQKPPTSDAFTARVPVWFHVIAASRSSREGWVSDDQIRRQIDVLNKTLAGAYGGADTGLRFDLVGVTRTIDREWFEMETFAAETEAKQALQRGDATTLNVYSNSGGGYLGWAYYPTIVAGNSQYLDGIVIHFDSMPGGRIRNYNLGYTATHEVGHWLGLAHTFDQGCNGHGDRVDDTPEQHTPTAGCPIGKDTCPAPGLDPVHNYMDYSYDTCYTQFTKGQALRGQEQYLHWRVKHGY